MDLLEHYARIKLLQSAADSVPIDIVYYPDWLDLADQLEKAGAVLDAGGDLALEINSSYTRWILILVSGPLRQSGKFRVGTVNVDNLDLFMERCSDYR